MKSRAERMKKPIERLMKVGKLNGKKRRWLYREIYYKPQGKFASHLTGSDFIVIIFHPAFHLQILMKISVYNAMLLYSFTNSNSEKPQDENFHIIISFTTTNVFLSSTLKIRKKTRKKPQQKKRQGRKYKVRRRQNT